MSSKTSSLNLSFTRQAGFRGGIAGGSRAQLGISVLTRGSVRDWGALKECGLMGVTIRELNGSHNENVRSCW